MHSKYNGASVTRMMATLGIIGAVLAGLGALTVRDVYISQAVMAGANIDADALANAQQRVLTEPRLQSIVEKHGLYPGVSSQEAVETTMKNIRVSGLRHITKADESFTVAFTHPDPAKARSVVTELTQAIIEEQRELKVLDSATLPDSPIYPNRKMFVFTGLLAGAILGALWALIQSTPIARMAAATGLAGALLAGAGSLAIDNVYHSRAALTGAEVTPESILQTTERVLAKRGITSADAKKQVRVSSPVKRRNGEYAFSVAFAAADRRVAREVTSELAQAIIDESNGRISMLDRASLPGTPTFPNREMIAFTGLLAGAVAGTLWAVFRRRPPAAAPAMP